MNPKLGGSSPAQKLILAACLVVSIVLVTAYAREGSAGPLHEAQAAVSNAIAPVKAIGAAADAGAEGVRESIADATASEETLSLLRERNAELTELVTRAEEYRLEAERLQGLLDIKDVYNIEGVAARVIGRTTDAWNQTVTIDVGSDEGVKPGLTVMGPAGVIGQVVSSSAGASTVRLLSDPASGAAALVQSSRAEGVVRGSLSGLLHLENVDAASTLQVGDAVLTSGMGGSYTRGLLIGTVVRIDGNAGEGTQSVVVAPNEQAGVLEEVLVVFDAAASGVPRLPQGGENS